MDMYRKKTTLKVKTPMKKIQRYFNIDVSMGVRADALGWCETSDVAKLEESHAELLKALELAERKLLRLHISLSLNEKAGRRSADADTDMQEIRAAITKAKGDHQ